MRVPHDTLSDTDRRYLQEFARRMQPHVEELIAEWTEAWLRQFPASGVDPDAYRQVIVYSMDNLMRPLFDLIAAGRFDDLYERQYSVNREGARAQLHKGSIALYDQRDLHVVGRLGQPIMLAWIGRMFPNDSTEALRVELAQERLGAQMATILSDAYSDEREGHLEKISDRLQRALVVSEHLRKVGHAIVQSLDVEPVLDVTVQTAMQLFDAQSSGLSLANRDGTAIQLCRLRGLHHWSVGHWLPLEDNLSGWVFRNNRAARSDRLDADVSQRTRDAIRQMGIVSYQIVPLRIGGHAIGALGVSYLSERRFWDEDEHTLQQLADSVAIAIQNARVHAEVRDALRDAERANRAKSEFVAAVSHEIRSPLNALVGYVQLLRDGTFGAISDEQETTLERLDTIARSTLRLTDDLLENARIEAGKLPIRVQSVAVQPLLDELTETGRLLLAERPVRFEVTRAPNAITVRADPDRLRQILMNLLTNAVKFTPAGNVTLAAARSAQGDRIEFTVRDTGPGISPHDLPRVFDLFYRADGSNEVSGAGVGLFLSRQLANLMGGQLAVESHLAIGSVFTLSLPAAD